MDQELRNLAISFEDTQFDNVVKVSVTYGDGTTQDMWMTRKQVLHLAEKTRQHYAGH